VKPEVMFPPEGEKTGRERVQKREESVKKDGKGDFALKKSRGWGKKNEGMVKKTKEREDQKKKNQGVCFLTRTSPVLQKKTQVTSSFELKRQGGGAGTCPPGKQPGSKGFQRGPDSKKKKERQRTKRGKVKGKDTKKKKKKTKKKKKGGF